MYLTAEQIAHATAALPYEDVPVPELAPPDAPERDKATIRVVCMSALDKDTWDLGFIKRETNDAGETRPVYSAVGARGRLLALTCRDQAFGYVNRDPAFWDGIRSDVADRLYAVAERLSGLDKDLEALKKAFGAARSGAWPSSSPTGSTAPTSRG